ncbi:MAG TPA: putative Ig domain-containing protein [Candidatus Omnitrophota bacterium]|nr:putative Ig domain-containing protein [Candidatus Omnitrophota bacterium]
MNSAARILGLAITAAALLLVGAPSRAQYLWLDSNGDGVNTAADHLAANGTPTTVDAWVNTSHNKDGSVASCDSGDPASALQIWNSYAIHLNVVGGTATFTSFVNRKTTFTIPCAAAGVGFLTNNSTQMSTCQASGSPENNGGANLRMFTVTVTGTSGTPSLAFVPTNSLDLNPTSFGTSCGGMDFDNTYKLGSDFHDADGIGSVIEPGNPPILTAPLTANGTEGQAVSITAVGNDPDAGQILTLSATGQPSSLTLATTPGLAPVTGTLSGTLGFNDQGSHTITWRVSDGITSVTKTTGLTVANVDRAPVVTAPPTVAGTVGVPLSVAVTASDPDGDAIGSLTAAPIPSGATFSGGGFAHTSGVLDWTPSVGQDGSTNIVFSASNALTGSATTHFEIAAASGDLPPVVTSPAAVSGAENALLSFTANASDPDGDAIVALTATPLPTGATFTANPARTSGTFQWTPTFAQAGAYTVTLSAQTACRPAPISGTICPTGVAITNLTIANVDRPPALNAIADATVPELEVDTRAVLASDPDGEVITLTASLPSFAILQSPTSGAGSVSTTITLAPGTGTTGSYTGSVTAASNGLTATRTFAITVVPPLPDAPPTVTSPAGVSGTEAQLLSFTATASDPDGDAITSFTAAPLPAGAAFSSNASHTAATFVWIPSLAQSGVYPVTLSAKSSCRAGGVSEPVVCLVGTAVTTLTIADVDQPPVVVAPASKLIGEASLLSFTVTATDPDGEAILSLAIDPLPMGAVFTVNAAHTSGTFNWTPDYTQSGTYLVAFTAKTACRVVAGGGVACPTATATTMITVANTDRVPLVGAPPNPSVDENARLTFNVSVTDPDGDPIDSLRAAPLPSGATFTANATRTSGTFDWTPNFAQAGNYLVTIAAKSACRADPISGIVCGVGTAQTHITVVNVDRPPVVTAPAAASGDEGALLTFQATASDPDAEPIESLEATPLPLGATFTKNTGNTSATFAWTPGFDAAGAYSITISAQSACRPGPVSEPVCGTGTAVTAITIRNVDRAPVVAAPASVAVDEGASLVFAVTASDPDGQPIASFTAGLLPPGATFAVNAGNTSGTFSWTPDYTRAAGSPYTAIFLASNALTAFARTDIAVNDVNGPPQIVCPAAITAQPNQFVTFTVSVSDPDGDPIASLDADLTALPAGAATFSKNAAHTSGTFAWSPQLQDVRDVPYPVVFTAANARTGTATTLITVRGQNHAPTAEAGGPYSGFVGVPVLFDATASSDPDGDALQYLWSFGDGATAAGPTPWHTYAAPLDAMAHLTVTETSTASPLSATDSAAVHIGTSLPARAFTTGGNKTLRLRSGKPSWCAQLEPMNGAFQAADVDLASVVMRSTGTGTVTEIASTAGKTGVLQDSDKNGVMELAVCFRKDDLIQLLSKISGRKPVPVQIAGRLISGAPFSASLTLDVAASTSTLAASIAPNPFNPSTTLSFRMERGGAVDLRIFDLKGRLVRDVTQGAVFGPGYQEIRIDGKDQNGRRIASGVYFYRLSTAEGSASGRLVLIE